MEFLRTLLLLLHCLCGWVFWTKKRRDPLPPSDCPQPEVKGCRSCLGPMLAYSLTTVSGRMLAVIGPVWVTCFL